MDIRAVFDKRTLRATEAKLEKRRKKALLRKNIKSALRVGAAISLEEAKRLVPVDTGKLRDDLKIRVYGNSIIIRSVLPYATAQEFKNRPFLRPTLKTKKTAIVDAVRQEYKKIVDV